MSKQNCWEFFECKRGLDSKEDCSQKVCSASIDVRLDGINKGKNGGRSCWASVGSFSGNLVECLDAK